MAYFTVQLLENNKSLKDSLIYMDVGFLFLKSVVFHFDNKNI